MFFMMVCWGSFVERMFLLLLIRLWEVVECMNNWLGCVEDGIEVNYWLKIVNFMVRVVVMGIIFGWNVCIIFFDILGSFDLVFVVNLDIGGGLVNFFLGLKICFLIVWYECLGFGFINFVVLDMYSVCCFVWLLFRILNFVLFSLLMLGFCWFKYLSIWLNDWFFIIRIMIVLIGLLMVCVGCIGWIGYINKCSKRNGRKNFLVWNVIVVICCKILK